MLSVFEEWPNYRGHKKPLFPSSFRTRCTGIGHGELPYVVGRGSPRETPSVIEFG